MEFVSEASWGYDKKYKAEIKKQGFLLRNVRGDGNCAVYATLLGLDQLGKVPPKIFETNDNVAGASLYMRRALNVFMKEHSDDIWKSLPKDADGDLDLDYNPLSELNPRRAKMNGLHL